MSGSVRELLRGWHRELDGMYEAALSAPAAERPAILDRAAELADRDMELRRAVRAELGR